MDRCIEVTALSEFPELIVCNAIKVISRSDLIKTIGLTVKMTVCDGIDRELSDHWISFCLNKCQELEVSPTRVRPLTRTDGIV
jgi:hypothetical protein